MKERKKKEREGKSKRGRHPLRRCRGYMTKSLPGGTCPISRGGPQMDMKESIMDGGGRKGVTLAEATGTFTFSAMEGNFQKGTCQRKRGGPSA